MPGFQFLRQPLSFLRGRCPRVGPELGAEHLETGWIFVPSSSLGKRKSQRLDPWRTRQSHRMVFARSQDKQLVEELVLGGGGGQAATQGVFRTEAASPEVPGFRGTNPRTAWGHLAPEYITAARLFDSQSPRAGTMPGASNGKGSRQSHIPTRLSLWRH